MSGKCCVEDMQSIAPIAAIYGAESCCYRRDRITDCCCPRFEADISQVLRQPNSAWVLEQLNGLVDEYFTPAALAAINPADNVSAQIIREANKLDDDHNWRNVYVLTSSEVFGNLVRLNPSILEAMKLCGGHVIERLAIPQASRSRCLGRLAA
jgi:hypothetical protein